MPTSLRHLTLTESLHKISNKEIKVEEIWDDVLAAINRENPKLNAYLSVAKTPVLPTGYANSLLKGIPLAVKDNFCTTDLPTTASSAVLKDFQPQFESSVTKKIKTAGAGIVGKTNLDAWAHGSSTETSDFGRTLNPRNLEFLPGGSSGGSAAAVAADLCMASISSETAGSIRQPASWCGAVGLKPTYGRVSRYGVVAMASSTDSPGPLTKTVADAALLLNVMAGHDPYDGTSSPQNVPDFTTSLNQSIKGLKVGVLYADLVGLEEQRPHLEAVVKVLTELGAEVELAPAMDPNYAISSYTIFQRGEVSSNLARYDGVRYGQDRSHFGAESKRRVMLGTFTLAKGYAEKYYQLAQKVRSLFIQDYQRLFAKYDVVISFTSPGFAKKVGVTEGEVMFGELEDMLLEPSSITGLPGVSVPCYHDSKTNLYLGLNINAPLWREDLCIRLADSYEQATSWNSWR